MSPCTFPKRFSCSKGEISGCCDDDGFYRGQRPRPITGKANRYRLSLNADKGVREWSRILRRRQVFPLVQKNSTFQRGCSRNATSDPWTNDVRRTPLLNDRLFQGKFRPTRCHRTNERVTQTILEDERQKGAKGIRQRPDTCFEAIRSLYRNVTIL